MYVAPSQVGILLISVMSQQYNCLMELYTIFYKILPFHENVSSFFFHVCVHVHVLTTCRYMYVSAEMNVHAFMNELD